jgi:hypothetical protein
MLARNGAKPAQLREAAAITLRVLDVKAKSARR